MTQEMMQMLQRVTTQEEYTAGLALYRAGGVHALEEEGGINDLRWAKGMKRSGILPFLIPSPSPQKLYFHL